jgi:hypothetical protein
MSTRRPGASTTNPPIRIPALPLPGRRREEKLAADFAARIRTRVQVEVGVAHQHGTEDLRRERAGEISGDERGIAGKLRGIERHDGRSADADCSGMDVSGRDGTREADGGDLQGIVSRGWVDEEIGFADGGAGGRRNLLIGGETGRQPQLGGRREGAASAEKDEGCKGGKQFSIHDETWRHGP